MTNTAKTTETLTINPANWLTEEATIDILDQHANDDGGTVITARLNNDFEFTVNIVKDDYFATTFTAFDKDGNDFANGYTDGNEAVAYATGIERSVNYTERGERDATLTAIAQIAANTY